MAKMKRKKTNHGRAGLAGVSKKDFVSIANVLCRNGASSALVDDMASYFKSENPAFDRGRFTTAARTCKR